MSIIELTKKFDRLPEIAKREVEDFIDFLEKKYSKGQKRSPTTKVSNFGSAAGLIEMADDFDDPLDDFKEYM